MMIDNFIESTLSHLRRFLSLLFFLASMICLVISNLLDRDVAQYGTDSFISTLYDKEKKGVKRCKSRQ